MTSSSGYVKTFDLLANSGRGVRGGWPGGGRN